MRNLIFIVVILFTACTAEQDLNPQLTAEDIIVDHTWFYQYQLVNTVDTAYNYMTFQRDGILVVEQLRGEHEDLDVYNYSLAKGAEMHVLTYSPIGGGYIYKDKIQILDESTFLLYQGADQHLVEKIE